MAKARRPLTVVPVEAAGAPPAGSASDWNVNDYLWSGRLRITAEGEKLALRFEDGNTGVFTAGGGRRASLPHKRRTH